MRDIHFLIIIFFYQYLHTEEVAIKYSPQVITSCLFPCPFYSKVFHMSIPVCANCIGDSLIFPVNQHKLVNTYVANLIITNTHQKNFLIAFK